MEEDGRRHSRASVNLHVEVEAARNRWSGRTIDLSPYGVKVAARGSLAMLPPGAPAQVQLTLGDREAPLSLPAKVVGADADGVNLNFESPDKRQLQRLKSFVDAVLQQDRDASHPENAQWIPLRTDPPAHAITQA